MDAGEEAVENEGGFVLQVDGVGIEKRFDGKGQGEEDEGEPDVSVTRRPADGDEGDECADAAAEEDVGD